jgi:hypothetical protein
MVLIANDLDLPRVTVWKRDSGTPTSGTYTVVNTTVRYAVPDYDDLKAAVTDSGGDPDPNKSVSLTVMTDTDDRTLTGFAWG